MAGVVGFQGLEVLCFLRASTVDSERSAVPFAAGADCDCNCECIRPYMSSADGGGQGVHVDRRERATRSGGGAAGLRVGG